MSDTPAAAETPSDEDVATDLALVIGGGFNVDEIGPDAHAEVSARVRAAPDRFLDVFEARYLGAEFDPLQHARLHVPALFRLLADTDQQRLRTAIEAELRHLRGALLVLDATTDRDGLEQTLPEETVNTLIRLEDRRRTLQAQLEQAQEPS